MTDVIIIGAGAAGLLAAKTLSAEGVQVIVLEARDRLGGRIHTLENGFSCNYEAGAEFIHGKLKLTRQLLKEAGLKQIKVKGTAYTLEHGSLKKSNEFVEGWPALINQLKKLETDITIEHFLDKYLPGKEYAATRESFKKYVQGYDSADIKDASALSIREEMENEDDQQYRVENGYSSLIDFLASQCTINGCTIKTSTVVKQINWQKNVVELFTDKQTYKAAKVVITVPLGVLRATENDLGAIKFVPGIIGGQHQFNNIGFGNVVKILMEFDEAFWLQKTFYKEKNIDKPFFFFAGTFIPPWWTQYPAKKPLLVGWLAGPGAKPASDLCDDEFLEKALSSLAEIFGMPPVLLRKKLQAHQICNWVKDPFCRGAYSYPTPATKKAVQFFNKPVEKTLYFAGEAFAKSGTATVDAAFQSGKEVAKKILRG